MRFFSLLLVGVAFAFGAAAEDVPQFTISTIAGTGKAVENTDVGKALDVPLSHPTAVAVDSKGNVYIADHNNRLIRKVTPDGMLTNVMGTGEAGSAVREGVALEIPLDRAYGVAVDYDDNLYVSSRGHSVIYKVTPDGRAAVIAGNGERGFSGDGGPATEASISWSNHMVADREGNLYVADSGNRRVRKIDTNGIITTIAGTGEEGFSGDGGPALDAQMTGGSAIAMDDAGNLFVADFSNHRIRKIDSNGIITTVAGTGEPRYNGEGLPATESNIGEPCGVDVDSDGYIYIGDQLNRRVRVVTPAGTMHTVAGTGKWRYSGDGGPALEADVKNPDIIAFGPDGALYFPDNQNNVIRKLVRAGNGE